MKNGMNTHRRHRLTRRQEDCIVFWCVIAAGIVAFFFSAPAKPEVAIIPSAPAAAGTAAKARELCPQGMRIRATMSVSKPNLGAWPEWRVVCIGDMPKKEKYHDRTH